MLFAWRPQRWRGGCTLIAGAAYNRTWVGTTLGADAAPGALPVLFLGGRHRMLRLPVS